MGVMYRYRVACAIRALIGEDKCFGGCGLMDKGVFVEESFNSVDS